MFARRLVRDGFEPLPGTPAYGPKPDPVVTFPMEPDSSQTSSLRPDRPPRRPPGHEQRLKKVQPGKAEQCQDLCWNGFGG